jgi:hypothetical protein
VTDGRRRGQRRGQRRRHTVVYTVLVVAVMDDNHISVVSHRRENVRFVAERWGLKGIGKGDKGSGRGGGDLALTSFFFFFHTTIVLFFLEYNLYCTGSLQQILFVLSLLVFRYFSINVMSL